MCIVLQVSATTHPLSEVRHIIIIQGAEREEEEGGKE